MGCFSELLEQAKSGDSNAVEQLLLLYKPLIESSSIYHGKLDEDLRQFIILRILQSLPEFRGKK